MKKLLCALALLALVIVLLPAQEARAEYHDGDLCPQCNLNPLYVFYTDENFHTVTCSTCGYTTTEFHFGGMATPIDGPQCEGCGETYGAPVDPIEVNCVYYVAGQYYLTKINPPQSYDCHYQMDWWTGPVEFNEVVEIGGNYYLAANVDTMVYKAAGGLYISYVPGWPATCTENGQEDYWQCRICKRMYSEKACENQIQEPVVIPAGHDLVEVKKVEPTCATPGVKTFTCTVCGDTYTQDIPVDLNKHDYSKEEILIQPNCTDVGQKKLSCIYCNDFIVETLPAVGHSFTTWTVYKPATTEAPGEERCYCDHDCGMYESREIPQLPPEEIPDEEPGEGGDEGGGSGADSVTPD